MDLAQWIRTTASGRSGKRRRRARWLLLLLSLLPLGLGGCLKHTRLLERPRKPAIVLTSSPEQLVKGLDERYDAIHTMKATVMIQASVGGERKGKVTEYTSIRGFILLRQPDKLRVLGLLPVVETRAFDMVSDGKSFKLFIPPKDKAIVGTGTVTIPSANPLMNLRPSVFYDSLLVGKVGPDDLIYVTSDTRIIDHSDHPTEEPDYELGILRHAGTGRLLMPERIIHISRTNLLPYQQDEYNDHGIMVTRTLYSDYKTFDHIPYPTHIVILRPIDGYKIDLKFEKVTFNHPLADDQFQLKIPSGTKIKHLP